QPGHERRSPDIGRLPARRSMNGHSFDADTCTPFEFLSRLARPPPAVVRYASATCGVRKADGPDLSASAPPWKACLRAPASTLRRHEPLWARAHHTPTRLQTTAAGRGCSDGRSIGTPKACPASSVSPATT